MGPPMRQNRQTLGGKESDESDFVSNNLWVGNLPADVTESGLAQLFSKFGQLDSLTSYSSRSYAFIYYKRVEDAMAAKQALQGATFGGNQIKIEFARPAKPCKNLWVGGISPSISKEDLEEEFKKFGKLEDFKFIRDRNTAFVEYFRLEDATQAAKSMNGKRIGGEQIRVDFLRSLPSRREQWPISHETRDSTFLSRGMAPSDGNLSAKRPLPPSSGARKADGQPSNVLWIGYPPSVQIDEQMLHNAMILFGEIERIKSFPSRHYSFVEFRSVEEARRAKEGLQGRLFNDPRITIMFSSSELAPGKDYPGFYSGIKASRPEMLFNEHPFRHSPVDVFGHNNTMTSNTFPGPPPSGGIVGPSMRPFGVQGSFERLHPGQEFNDLTSNPKNIVGPNWRKPSPPASGLVPSPAQGIRLPVRPSPGSWDVYDVSQLERESKRSRRDGHLAIDEATFPVTKIDDRGSVLDHSYGVGPGMDGGPSDPYANVQGKRRLSPVPAKVVSGAGYPDTDYIWRGIIAKGGTPVCHARCVPIGRGIGTELPEVVNCSARTGLDMLTKHYAEAIGFDIVFFLPDSEDDFASYTEFLRYLGSKNRAGVAKFNDGTTLFLVPPSDFLTKVLKVSGPERLYGVVLKLPPPVPTATSFMQDMSHPLPSSFMDRPRISSSEPNYSLLRTKEEHALAMDYNRVFQEESKPPSKPYLPPISEPVVGQAGPREQTPTNATAVSQAGVTLTPELIATLATLLPATSQSSVPVGHQPSLGSSTVRPSFNQTVAPPHKENSLQGWNQDKQASEPAGHSYQLSGNQYNTPAQLPQTPHYPSISSTPSYPAQLALANTQFPEPSVSLSQQAAASSRPLANFTSSSQGSHIAASPPVNKQYQFEVPPSTQKGYGVLHGADASGLYSAPAFQHANNSGVSTNQVHGTNPSQPQNVVPLSVEKVNLELPTEVQQLQSVLTGAGQGASDAEGDKNQRYQSTLQFAASLLLQIQQQQQQQQQTNTPAARGTGNQL